METSALETPSVSCIAIVDFSQEARWIFCTESVSDLLGYEPHELIGASSLELVHPDEFKDIKQTHYDTISQDKAAALLYTRMRHKDPAKGYVLCAISRTVVHDVLAGSLSFADPGPKAMQNASTAQEITFVTPVAQGFQFRRWNDPHPMPPQPHPDSVTSRESTPSTGSTVGSSPRSGVDDAEDASETERSDYPDDSDAGDEERSARSYTGSPPSRRRSVSPSKPVSHGKETSSSKEKKKSRHASRRSVITFEKLPRQSVRTLLILDRFSVRCPVMYCSNDFLLSTTVCMGRSFYDFVAKKDEELVRSWVDAIKGWGVNERGQPSDGGFGFGKFVCCRKGRDSSAPQPDPNRRRGERSRQHSLSSPVGTRRHGEDKHKRRNKDEDREGGGEFQVDAIFSAHSDGLMVILRRTE